MGWGVGMGIGWSTTPANGTPGVFIIERCNGSQITVYSDSDFFVPEITVYEDQAKTIPFSGSPGDYWNLTNLILTIGGYEIDAVGIVQSGLITCPV